MLDEYEIAETKKNYNIDDFMYNVRNRMC